MTHDDTGSADGQGATQDAEDHDRLFEQRLDKLNRLRAAGVDPYPARFNRTDLAADVVASFEQEPGKQVRVAGRVVGGIRRMGRATFMHLQDASGRIQAFFRQNELGAEQYALLDLIDSGDFLGVVGETMKTRTGEISVQARELHVLSKALRPLPEKWHGLQDVELRYRRRYVDLTMNPEVREVFVKRARIVQSIRNFFDQRGYIEVETPMMHSIAGGAAARPLDRKSVV